MQHGIYYAYWEHEWNGNYHYYIDKVAKLGYDILEIAAGPLPEYSNEELKALKDHAKEQNIRLTVGYVQKYAKRQSYFFTIVFLIVLYS